MTAPPQVPSFDPLHFHVDGEGQAHFDGAVFQQHHPTLSGILPSEFNAQPMDLIIIWYLLHQAQGGAPNADLEALLQEVEFEESRGQGFSLPAGHA